MFMGNAAGSEALSGLEPDTQVESNWVGPSAPTIKIAEVRGETAALRTWISSLETRRLLLQRRREALIDGAVLRADDSSYQGRLGRTAETLRKLNAELAASRDRLEIATEALTTVSKRVQARYRSAVAEPQTLRTRSIEDDVVETGVPGLKISGELACPVAGPVSFTDSWGAPRVGHTHQGADMMSDYGVPVVAITSGTASYVAYDGSGGNMIWIDGDDGNSYWYMHNQENLISQGQRVSMGQQIATVGDTGNASGTPHLHFELHPGGGSAVNPYPLVSSLC